MGARPLLAGLVAAAALAAAPQAHAQADDPGRWRLANVTPIPLAYNQGIAVSPARQLFFTSTSGIFRTSATLREGASAAVVIPAAVTQREGYDHVGDLAYDRREGGRLLLPLECYRPGGPNGGNHCGTGAIGVADPRTLAWRYHVRLDRRDIKKAMWAEVSPDRRFLWTSSGPDLLRYDLRAIRRGNAAPAGRPLRPSKRLRHAVPPSGITGATFVGGRLFVAGGNDGPAMQIWSIDLKIGERRLEIEREISGESEGLATVRLFGGTLQWTVLPFDGRGRPPTYGDQGALLSFSARR